MRAAGVASAGVVGAARSAARSELGALVDRLWVALDLPAEQIPLWHQSLPALLPGAARGIWPVEARLLYDLQKVCVDHERHLYAVDLVEWVRSLGRRPIKRPLPEQREVLRLKYLRSAAGRLVRARLPEEERRTLTELLGAAVERGEAGLRQRFRPLIAQVLDDVGLAPPTLVEKLGRQQLIEGLLDRTVARGFLGLGDLRDALSSNSVKLPDLIGSWVSYQPEAPATGSRRCAPGW